MNDSRDTLGRILGPAGPDSGCDRSGDLLDQLVDAQVSGREPSEALREVATHLAACPDCYEDYLGLRALAGAASDGPEDEPASS